jgi:hypothetical protein
MDSPSKAADTPTASRRTRSSGWGVKTPDHVAFSHAGHAINSYALNYQLVDGPLAVIAQVGWGGGYSNRAEDTL